MRFAFHLLEGALNGLGFRILWYENIFIICDVFNLLHVFLQCKIPLRQRYWKIYKQAWTYIIDKSEKYDYNYDLIHQLYQLDSNCTSAYNQQRILKIINNLTIKNKSISFRELKKLVKDIDDISISEDILRREVEILILRGLLDCQIQGDQLIFSHH